MIWGIILFLFITLPYQGLIPVFDGRHDLINVFGMSLMFNQSAHPPFKTLILENFINLFGVYSYTWLGLLLGITGIAGIYLLTKILLKDKKPAIIASILLATSGLYVSNSLFSMTDFMIAIFAIYTFYFYYTQKLNWYSFITIVGVLTKETFLLVPISILIVSILQKKFKWRYLMFLVAFGTWLLAIYTHHLTPWNQQNFSEFSKYGSFGTIFMNLITLKIFNQYAFGAWLQMLVLNFNWVFWGLVLLQLGQIKWNKSDLRYFSPIILFFFSYIFLVVSFPTWAIPRYFLPIWPFLLIFLSAHLWKNKVALALIFIVSFTSLFYSADSLSHGIYETRELFEQKFYSVPNAGNDGLTYNMQFLNHVKNFNQALFKDEIENCYDVFLGMKDDKELRLIYNFTAKPCP